MKTTNLFVYTVYTCWEEPGKGENNPPERAGHAEQVDEDKYHGAHHLILV